MLKKIIVSINLLLILSLTGYQIYKEENYRKNNTIILPLAPVDPRSLMQGDYMILNFNIEREFNKSEWKNEKKGYLKLKIDENGISHFNEYSQKLAPNSIKFDNRYKFTMGVDSYFFQDGKDKHFQQARFAQLFLLKDGSLRLDRLLDKDLNDLTNLNKSK